MDNSEDGQLDSVPLPVVCSWLMETTLPLSIFFFFKGSSHIDCVHRTLFFFLTFGFIYLFIYGCVGFSFLCEGFL